jgi:hypothetical protein
MIGKAGEKAYAYPSPRFMLYSDVVIVFNIDLATTFVASAYGFHMTSFHSLKHLFCEHCTQDILFLSWPQGVHSSLREWIQIPLYNLHTGSKIPRK